MDRVFINKCKAFFASPLATRKQLAVVQTKELTRRLRLAGVRLEIDHPTKDTQLVLPTSRLMSTRLVLKRGGIGDIERIAEINRFLQLIADVPDRSGLVLRLSEAVENFREAVSELQDLGQKDLVSLARDCFVHSAYDPEEKIIDRTYAALLDIMTGSEKRITIGEICAKIVYTLQARWKTGNPNIMLYDREEDGQEYMLPTEIAMPAFVKKAGQKLRGKKLGEHRIKIRPDSDNLYVKAIQEDNLRLEFDISPETFRKLAEDFIDDKINQSSPYTGWLKTVFFYSKTNSLLMYPMKYRGRKIGLVTVLKKGRFKPEELDKIIFFLRLATFVLVRKQIENTLLEKTKEQKRMQKAMVEQAKLAAMGEMAGAASHAVKNSLAKIDLLIRQISSLLNEQTEAEMQALRVLASAGLPVDKSIERLERLQQQARELSGTMEFVLKDLDATVRGLLSFARVGSGEKIALPLKASLEVKMRLTRLQAATKGVRIITDFDGLAGNDGLLMAEGEFSDLIHNLLANAIQAFDSVADGRQKLVRVSVRKLPGQKIKLVIEDNGCGIKHDVLGDLFKTVGRTTKSTGTGMGMFTVGRIISSNEGEINVFSNEGQGTRFSITMPAVEVAGVRAAEVAQSAKAGLSQDKIKATRIVLIEDSAMLREQYKIALTKDGYQVIGAFADAGSALAAITKQDVEPDLIVADRMLPDMQGDELLDQVAKYFEGRGQPK
ncbi:MAG: response regulator, partial [Candidatus Margulisbacteria bacterium]|nr:response regulator [Candidatus Margulisiibacteriota bacterium]